MDAHDVNYCLVLLIIVILAVLLVIFLRRNAKDKRALGKKLSATEIKPKQHEDKDQRL